MYGILIWKKTGFLKRQERAFPITNKDGSMWITESLSTADAKAFELEQGKTNCRVVCLDGVHE